MKDLPADPYGRGPLTYRRTDDGFLLYSWSEDLKWALSFGGPGHRMTPVIDAGRVLQPACHVSLSLIAGGCHDFGKMSAALSRTGLRESS